MAPPYLFWTSIQNSSTAIKADKAEMGEAVSVNTETPSGESTVPGAQELSGYTSADDVVVQLADYLPGLAKASNKSVRGESLHPINDRIHALRSANPRIKSLLLILLLNLTNTRYLRLLRACFGLAQKFRFFITFWKIPE